MKIDAAVVVAEHWPAADLDSYGWYPDDMPYPTTFYIQDSNGGNGLAVDVMVKQGSDLPLIGQGVSVSGALAMRHGSLRIVSEGNVAVQIGPPQPGASVHYDSGAYPPAGNPVAVDQSTIGKEYAHTLPSEDAHPERVGQALAFSGPLSVTDEAPQGFVATQPDGGTMAEGFEVTGGLWIDQTYVFAACMKGKGPDGGILYPDLSHGIRGVWDRYQDDGSDGGRSPVLVPMECNDLGIDAGY